MFDIGFSEVLVIFVLALVVLGPEKLPKVAAQVGRWIGRARGMARQFREQLEEEVNLEEARKAQPRTPSPAVVPPASFAPVAEPAPIVPSPAVSLDPVAEAPFAPTPPTAVPPADAAEQPTSPTATPSPPMPPLGADQQIVYPDTYSHAHPTDDLGRPVAPPIHESPAAEAGQQDWVGGVTTTDKPAQTPADAAYAPPHERGT
jgi:sec-independent protein translocase protein TatB